MTVTYVTYSKLILDVISFVKCLPRNLVNELAGVVGIPRSGMVPATVLANYLHLPLSDLWSFHHTGYFSGAGRRLDNKPARRGGEKVLIIDDSAFGGRTMDMARTICNMLPSYEFYFCCLYRNPEKHPDLNYFYEDIPSPRYFEWNLMQHQDIGNFMLDIDGVLCYDSLIYDDDGSEYRQSIKDAVPHHLPKRKVHSLCTMRLEKWRDITKQWLGEQCVEFEHLYMPDYSSAEERRRLCEYGDWKGRVYAQSPCSLFVESNRDQARTIAMTSGKPVISLSSGEVFQ